MLFLKVTKEKHVFVAGSKFTSIGPIYYEYGSMIITFDNSDSAVQAYELLRVAIYEDKKLLGEPYTTSSKSGTRCNGGFLLVNAMMMTMM